MSRGPPPGSRPLAPGIGLGLAEGDLSSTEMSLPSTSASTVLSPRRLGFDVVVDVAHHDDYSKLLSVLARCAPALRGSSVRLSGPVPLEVMWERRRLTWGQDRALAGAARTSSRTVAGGGALGEPRRLRGGHRHVVAARPCRGDSGATSAGTAFDQRVCR